MEFANCTPDQLSDVLKSLSYLVENDSKLVDKALNLTKKIYHKQIRVVLTLLILL